MYLPFTFYLINDFGLLLLHPFFLRLSAKHICPENLILLNRFIDSQLEIFIFEDVTTYNENILFPKEESNVYIKQGWLN